MMQIRIVYGPQNARSTELADRVLAPERIYCNGIPDFDSAVARHDIKEFLLVVLRDCKDGRTEHAIRILTQAHTLSTVHKWQGLPPETVNVCTTIAQGSLDFEPYCRNLNFLPLFVHNYGQKRASALVFNLILPHLCTYTARVCAQDQISRTYHCEYLRFDAASREFIPIAAQLPVDSAGKPYVLIPEPLLKDRANPDTQGYARFIDNKYGEIEGFEGILAMTIWEPDLLEEYCRGLG
jgi:hypothetical protein